MDEDSVFVVEFFHRYKFETVSLLRRKPEAVCQAGRGRAAEDFRGDIDGQFVHEAQAEELGDECPAAFDHQSPEAQFVKRREHGGQVHPLAVLYEDFRSGIF